MSVHRTLPKVITVECSSHRRWRRDYNDRRPYGALGHLTPSEYAEQRQTHGSEAAELQLAPV